MSQICVVVHVPVFCPFSIMMWACREELPAKKTNKTPNKPCHLQCPSVRAKYAHWDRRMTSDTLISSLSLQDEHTPLEKKPTKQTSSFQLHSLLFVFACHCIYFLSSAFFFVRYLWVLIIFALVQPLSTCSRTIIFCSHIWVSENSILMNAFDITIFVFVCSIHWRVTFNVCYKLRVP